MNDLTYFNLVQETLLDKWKTTEKSLPLKAEDWEVGITLFSKIAIEFVERENHITRLSDKNISNSTSSLDDKIFKIKNFVQVHAKAFQVFCQTGLILSLDKSITEDALRYVLLDDSRILSYILMRSSNCMSEKELDKCFLSDIKNNKFKIAKSCSSFLQAYKKNADNRAGFYFLWLFNRYANCSFKMPRRRFFNNSSLTEVLTQFFQDKGCTAEWEKVVEIMIYRESKNCIYEEVLEEESHSLFLDLLPDLFENTPMSKWPNKASILMSVLEILTKESRLTLLKTLTSSTDHDTSTMGFYFSKIFTAKSLKKTISSLNALEETLPNVYDFCFRLISDQTLLEFRYGKVNEGENATRLNFNVLKMKGVFIQGSLMIGVQTCKDQTYLNAYDMHTEKRIWSLPLIMTNDQNILTFDFPKIKQVGSFLIIQFIEEKKLHFIDAETGEFKLVLKLPVASINNFESWHMSPMGYIYQIANDGPDRILIGGRLFENQWKPSFEIKAPNGFLRPFSTHCGFQSFDKLFICGPTGDLAIINGCIEAHVLEDKLFAIESDPLNKNGRLLTVRTLRLGKEVVSAAAEISIPINVRKITFGNISKDGQHVVLFSKNFSDTSPIFIDLLNEDVTYSLYKFYSHEEHMINPLTSELWTFDQSSKCVWKVSAHEKKCMGQLKYSRATTFLHVDQNDHLYYVVTKKASTASDEGKRLNTKQDKQPFLKSINIT